MQSTKLAPVKEDPKDFDAIEAEIIRFFRDEIYLPLMRELKSKLITNSVDDLIEAIRSGKVRYEKGFFKGSLNSTLTRELKKLGATWDRRQGSFSIPQSKLTIDIKQAISMSEARFEEVLKRIDKRLSAIQPKEITERLSLEQHFDTAIFRVDKKLDSSMRKLSITPNLTPEQKKRMSEEYANNLELYIQDFAENEVKELRRNISERAFSGYRYEGVVKEIQDSYGVSQRKAKFLARQETSLLMTKYKQIRYQDAGVNKYQWRCVKGTAAHPVRPYHKALDGKVFTWDNPPVVDETGNRKNPGQDYNCRCSAIPIVEF